MESDYFVHPTSIVDEGVSIGQKTKIWHWTHISENARIGEECNLGQGVFVGRNVEIGSNVKIQNNVPIYEGVVLEDHVFCGPCMVFTNVYNPRSEIVRKSEIKKTLVRKGATIGANATIVCGITLGQYCFIGAGSVILKSVPNFALMVGNPARQIGWMSRFGERIDLPLEGEGEYTCPHQGVTYVLNGKTMEIKE